MARVNKNGTNPDMFLRCLFLGATKYESPLYAPVYVHGAGLLVHPLSHALIPNTCSAPKGHNSNQVNWISLFAQKGTEETVRVSNNYRQKHLAKLVMAYNSGMASFLPGALD